MAEFTDGRYVVADTNARGARDPIALTSQVKIMRDGMERLGYKPGLILVVVADDERNEAVERIKGALEGTLPLPEGPASQEDR